MRRRLSRNDGDAAELAGEASRSRADFERLIGEQRPKLHRYCARMTGSVIDGEDVVQALAGGRGAGNQRPRGRRGDRAAGRRLFRIAHNTALDFLRRRARDGEPRGEEAMAMIADPDRYRRAAADRGSELQQASCACRSRSATASAADGYAPAIRSKKSRP